MRLNKFKTKQPGFFWLTCRTQLLRRFPGSGGKPLANYNSLSQDNRRYQIGVYEVACLLTDE